MDVGAAVAGSVRASITPAPVIRIERMIRLRSKSMSEMACLRKLLGIEQ
jgi:hypothetical protein